MWGEIAGTGLAGGGTGAVGKHGDTSQGQVVETHRQEVSETPHQLRDSNLFNASWKQHQIRSNKYKAKNTKCRSQRR